MTDEEFRAKVATELADIASCMRVLAQAEDRKRPPEPIKLPDVVVSLLVGGCIFALFSKSGDIFALCSIAILIYILVKTTVLWAYRKIFVRSEQSY